MENSAYVPGAGHISSPALVVFSQAAGGLTEALRIQRPFNPQLTLTDAVSKDLHRPFTATGLSLRHMEAYNSLPAHLLHHLQPQFLHPSLSLGSGAFRPLADLKAFPSPSAFGPPKCLKIETAGDGLLVNSHGHNIFSPSEDRFTGSHNSRTDSCSPASASLSPPPPISLPPPSASGHVKEESLDAHMSEDGDGNQTPGPANCDSEQQQVHEENRGFRRMWASRLSSLTCPEADGGGSEMGGGGERLALAGEQESVNSRTDSCSPASASLSPPPPISLPPPSASEHVKEESLDAHMSEDGDGNQTPGPANCESEQQQVHEENRGFRLGPLFGGGGGGFAGGGYAFSMAGHGGHGPGPVPPDAHSHNIKNNFLFENVLKKKRDSSCCPVCGMAVSPGELETHFLHELERLYKLSSNSAQANKARRHEGPRPPAHPGDAGPDGRWETFQRIKTNRQGRLRIKMRKRKADDCPMCIGRAHRSPDEHGEQCIRKGSVGNDEDETVDVEGDSEFEEWSSQRRLPTGPTVTGFNSSSSSTSVRDVDNDPPENEDLIVDGDEPEDSTHFRASETIVVINSANEDSSKERSPDGVQSQVATSSGDIEVKVESGQHCDSNVSTSDAEPSSRAQVLEDLKSRIRQLEAEAGGDTATSTDSEDFKCLICLEHYKKPVISTVCWHVHCEECWLHTLGTKKVCPQCSMIITPSDLRRIFM